MKPYPLRMDDKLREQLRSKAEENKRSINSEILLAIEKHLKVGKKK